MCHVRTRLAAPVLQMLAAVTPWVESELRGLRQLVRPGAVCVDVGAATGYYSAVLRHLTGPAGTVHSLEPLVFAYPTLSALLGVRRRPIALADSPGRFSMSVPLRDGRPVTGRAFLTHGATGLGANDEFAESIEVSVAADTLDNYFAGPRLDFMKIDVEGAELAVLKGGAGIIGRHHPTLLLEIEDRHTIRYGHTARDVVGWLTGRGYRMLSWQHNRWRLTSRVTPITRNYLFWYSG